MCGGRLVGQSSDLCVTDPTFVVALGISIHYWLAFTDTRPFILGIYLRIQTLTLQSLEAVFVDT